MRKNGAGLTILEKGDVVRIGKGKVLYTVTIGEDMSEFVTARSHNTNRPRTEHRDRWVLARPVADVENEVQEPEIMEENTSYQKAVLFALNRLGKHVYAGTVSKVKKAKTRKLNRRQKASRKANR